MQINGLSGLDIEKEISEKRLSPEYIYDSLISKFQEVATNYNDRKQAYRSRIKASDKEFSRTLDYFDAGLTAVDKSSKIIKEAVRNFNSPQYFEILAKANEPLEEFEKIEFDASKWSKENMENFDQLHSEWLGLKGQADHANKALRFLLKGKGLKAISSAFVFGLSFAISYYLGTYLEGRFVFIGEFWAKLVTALLFFIAVDWFLDIIKSKLVWTWINILYLGLKDMTVVDGLQQSIVDSN